MSGPELAPTGASRVTTPLAHLGQADSYHTFDLHHSFDQCVPITVGPEIVEACPAQFNERPRLAVTPPIFRQHANKHEPQEPTSTLVFTDLSIGKMSQVVQIPFSAFKLIDLGQSFGLPMYQSLYKDHSEPVGLVSVVQALGLLRPSDGIIESFNNR